MFATDLSEYERTQDRISRRLDASALAAARARGRNLGPDELALVDEALRRCWGAILTNDR